MKTVTTVTQMSLTLPQDWFSVYRVQQSSYLNLINVPTLSL